MVSQKGGKCLSKRFNRRKDKLHLQCKNGHKWKTKVAKRVGNKEKRGTGCKECYLENIKNTTNPSRSFSTTVMVACNDKFKGGPWKDSWWWKLFGPETKSDCILKYSKEVRERSVLGFIKTLCRGKTRSSKNTDKNY